MDRRSACTSVERGLMCWAASAPRAERGVGLRFGMRIRASLLRADRRQVPRPTDGRGTVLVAALAAASARHCGVHWR